MAEEQEAIEYFKTLKEYLGQYKQEWIEKGTYKFYETFEINLETVLNILKEKDKEIKCKSSSINALDCSLHERTEERDRKDYIIARQKKQIDLMAEKLEGVPINKNIPNFEKPNLKECITIFTNKEDLKQYFKSKAGKE